MSNISVGWHDLTVASSSCADVSSALLAAIANPAYSVKSCSTSPLVLGGYVDIVYTSTGQVVREDVQSISPTLSGSGSGGGTTTTPTTTTPSTTTVTTSTPSAVTQTLVITVEPYRATVDDYAAITLIFAAVLFVSVLIWSARTILEFFRKPSEF